eukprot:355569-Chlamydomonas_euryale.AAC.2
MTTGHMCRWTREFLRESACWGAGRGLVTWASRHRSLPAAAQASQRNCIGATEQAHPTTHANATPSAQPQPEQRTPAWRKPVTTPVRAPPSAKAPLPWRKSTGASPLHAPPRRRPTSASPFLQQALLVGLVSEHCNARHPWQA